MRSWTLVAAILLGLIVAPFATPAGAATTPVRLAVFGDTGTTVDTQQNVNGAVADGATGYVGLGDYYYWSAPSTWKSMFQPLTKGGAYMALGNHDDQAVLSEYFLNGATWSRSVNGARVVAINTEARMDVGSAQYNTVRGALCNAPESVRVLVLHKGWWLGAGARHPGSEFPGSAAAMDQMVKDCGVDLVLAGHEHNYQRMVRNGVSYAIVGTGGESQYAVAGSPGGTVASYQGYGRILLDLSSTGFKAEFRTVSGAVKDTFSMGTATPAPAPAPAPSPTPTPTPATGAATFSGSTGNEWWVQVKVAATNGRAVRGVEARDAADPWTPLAWQSWGAWAASFHVEPGHAVQYRATLSDGTVVQSCPFTHPAGVAQCGTTTPAPSTGFVATFSNLRGNAWWVEADVKATGGTLAGVEVRVNGGAWVALAKTSWGSWAKGMSAPLGGSIEFRARSADGAYSSYGPVAWRP